MVLKMKLNQKSYFSSWQEHPDVWIAGLAFVVRFWFLYKFSDSPFFEPIPGGNDRALYHGLAWQMAQGHFFPTGVFEHMPLYPWLLGLIYAIFGSEIHPGQNLYVAGLFGMLVDTATVFLFVRLACSLGAPASALWITGVLYALYPTAIIYSVQTMPNTLNAFLLVLFASVALRLRSSGSKRSWWGAGLLAGVAALGFAGMLLIVIGCVVYWIWIRIQNSEFRIQNFLVFLSGVIMPIVPVTFHNWQTEHRFVLVTAHGGFNFYMGNHANATGYPVQISEFRGESGSLLFDARVEAEKAKGRKLTSAEVSAYWSQKAWNFICENPLQELKLLGSKFLKFWNRSEYDDLRLLPMFRLTNTAFTSPFWPGFVWIGWLGFVGLILSRRCDFLKVITISGIVGVLCFFVTARYRLTFAPLLSVLGAIGLITIFGRAGVIADGNVNQRGRRLSLQNVLSLSIAGVIVWLPLPGSDSRALDHYNTAVYLLNLGKTEAALEQAIKGVTLEPREANFFFVIGNANFQLGKIEEALAAYKTTIHLKPSHSYAHYNLALTWMRLSEFEKAMDEALLTLQYDPQHPRARALLDQIRKQTMEKSEPK